MNRRRLLGLPIAIAVLGPPSAAAWAQGAGAASATMAVSVEVTPNCTVAAGALAFGSVTAAEAPLRETSASIEVACGPDVAFTVALDDGQNAANAARRALDPATGRTIGYEIYADPAHTRRWGSQETQAVTGVTASTGAERLTAYGVIENDPHVAPGRYGDLITVTTNF